MKKLMMVFAFIIVVLSLHGVVTTRAQACDKTGPVVTVSAKSGARIRAGATSGSRSLSKVPYGEHLTFLGEKSGQKVSITGKTSDVWYEVQTQKCVTGFVSSVLIDTTNGNIPVTQASSTAPTTNGVVAGGIFAPLNVTVKSAKYGGRSIRDLNRLMTITGRSGVWHNEEYHAGGHPFDHFLYDGVNSAYGYFYGVIIMQTSGGERQTWAWKQYDDDNELLVWVYQDLNANCDAQGNHCGTHHFAWWGAVPKSQWDYGVSR
jgi:hypothetical protein